MKIVHYALLILIVMESVAFAAGDVDNNGTVDLTDAVLSLQVCGGMAQSAVNTSSDVNADGKIGLEEAIYVLQKVSTPDTVYYYVDFDSGSDNNSGTSAGDAWKHAPGDANATGNPASVSLQGGDVVLFRADVVYKGSITIQAGGTEGNPITYLGQGWGEGKAIIDGSEALAGTWTLCESQDACGGNPNWEHIYYSDAPGDYSFFKSIFEDDQFLKYSQDPNQSNAVQYDAIEEFRVVPFGDPSITISRTSLTDPRVLTQADPDFYDDCYIAVWRAGNWVTIVSANSYNPSTNTLNYPDIGYDLYSDRDNCYSLLNHTSFIDTPGEYSLADGKIYAWLNNPGNIDVSVAERSSAFIISQDNIILNGFKIRNYYSATYSAGAIYASGNNIEIINNEVKNISGDYSAAIRLVNVDNAIVEYNLINYSRTRGLSVAGNNVNLNNNIVNYITGTGLYFGGVQNSRITNNLVDNIFSVHGNGISVYQGSLNILVANNIVKSHDILSFTYQQSGNIYVFQNLLYRYQDDNSLVQGVLTGSSGEICFFNNVIGNDDDKNNSLVIADTGADTYISMNNIIDGGGTHTDITRSNNIYTGLLWNQHPAYGWSLAGGEVFEENLNNIFADPVNSDLHLTGTSVAIDAGVDVTPYLTTAINLFPDFDFTKDIEGNTRSQGPGWDIGAYEYAK